MASLTSLKYVIPDEIRAVLPLVLPRLPIVAPIGGKMVRVRDTAQAIVADGDLDFVDVLAVLKALEDGEPIPDVPVITDGPEAPEDDDPAPSPLVWPDEVVLKVNWAQEPGLNSQGQQVLVPVPAVEGHGGIVLVGSHPGVVNDRTKITFEAGLRYRGTGLHFNDYPHLVGAIEWVAEDQNGNVLGTIGGSGSVAPGFPRKESGIGWGGTRYAESGGTLGVASIKPVLKGLTGINFYARVPSAPGTPRSRYLISERVV